MDGEREAAPAAAPAEAACENARGPLHGVRVLDLTGTMSGPFCTLLLAQLGARIDKIEPPTGDVVRHLTPGRTPAMSPIFLALNAGKRSIVLDLAREPDRELLMSSLPEYDVVVHNMRPRAAARLGLTAEKLAAAGSEALLCELVGFGPGPYEDRPAYDDTIQAESGMAWVQGNGGEPAYVRTAVADKTAGMYAALAICAELASRAAGGPRRSVRIPMFETMVAFTAVEQMGGLTYEPANGPALYPRTASPHRKPFPTRDGHVSLMLYTDRHWAAFLSRIGRYDLVDEPAFATLAGRTANIDEVYALVAAELLQRTTAEWLDILEEIDVPHARVRSLPDLLTDRHLAAAALFHEVEHPTEGTVRSVRAPFLFDGRRPADLAPARALGQDSAGFRRAGRGRTATQRTSPPTEASLGSTPPDEG
ncbi:CaiB/BaiF CoA transferase family protein [Actinomadura formosensis]|uniref:CaiB/BaiF CoA transferase family protein n=1 Tax=Actinomadura formosensis TaxID=60706 RepID=UPI003D8FEC55